MAVGESVLDILSRFGIVVDNTSTELYFVTATTVGVKVLLCPQQGHQRSRIKCFKVVMDRDRVPGISLSSVRSHHTNRCSYCMKL